VGTAAGIVAEIEEVNGGEIAVAIAAVTAAMCFVVSFAGSVVPIAGTCLVAMTANRALPLPATHLQPPRASRR
jgi:hypothetical protein